MSTSTHASSFPLPPEFSWLPLSCRPSAKEVETYAHIINAVEHNPPDHLDTCLREAELQLWIWRNEAKQSATRRRRAPRRVERDDMATASAAGAATAQAF